MSDAAEVYGYETRAVTSAEIEQATSDALRREREHVREPHEWRTGRPPRDDVGKIHPAEGFTGPQVCAVIGITYRQLDYWARTGLMVPLPLQTRRTGSRRRYSYSDLLQMKVIQRLLDAGVSLQATRRAIETMRSSAGDLTSANLVIDDRRAVLAYAGQEIIDLLEGGQTVLSIVPLTGIVSEVGASLRSLGVGSDEGARGSTPSGG